MALKIVVPKAPPAPTLPSHVAPDLQAIQQHYPKIGDKISLMWGSAGLQNYLNKIIIDERGGREGFPMHVLSALIRIYEHHSTLIPPPEPGCTWDHVK